jgi:hypothetical protein
MKLTRKYRQLIRQSNRIGRMKLATCLRWLGVPAKRGNAALVTRASVSALYTLFETAKLRYLAGAKRIRTDLAENHEAAVVWNALWAHAKKLFLKRGIEI